MPEKNITRIFPIWVLLMFLLVYCGKSDARDLYTIEAADSSSSDDINLNTYTLSYISNRRSHFWPYEESADSNFDWGAVFHRYDGDTSGIDFTGDQLELELGWRYSNMTYFGGRIGAHQLDVPSLDRKDDRVSYDLSAQIGLARSISLNLDAADDYVYQLGLQPGGVQEFLNAEKWQADLEWKPIETIRLTGSNSRWNLSDNNTRKMNTFRLLYGRESPWLWAGVAYEKLEYDEIKPGYWSPHNFRSVGFEFESSVPLTASISGSLSGSISRIKENSFPQGNGYSVFAGIDYAIIDNYTLRFGLSRINSEQMSSTWTEDAYRLSLNGSFF